jgi:Protein of unknown function (DUF2568)
METLEVANLALRLLQELCALAALGYWGFKVGGNLAAKVGLGIGAPLLAAVLWGIFVAPRAPVQTTGLLSLILELVIFGSAAAALYAARRPTLAWALALVFVANRALMYAWGQ